MPGLLLHCIPVHVFRGLHFLKDTMNTQECQVQAYWKHFGNRRLPKSIYCIPCRPGGWVVDHIGAVKERNDGRWNWWRWPSNFHKTWNGEGQGVAASKYAAMLQVLDGWELENELQHIRDSQKEKTLTEEQAKSLREEKS